MRTRTALACIAALATTLAACDGEDEDVDAGTDAGMDDTDAGMDDTDAGMDDEDAGSDAGSDAGPPQPDKFGIRLANMIAGLTPDADEEDPADDRAGAIRLCLDTAVGPPMHLTATRGLPYGGVSPYFPFIWGITYTVTAYDSGTFPAAGCPDDVADPVGDLFTATLEASAVTVGEFHTAIATGLTTGFCTVQSIDPCPPTELAIFEDDYSAPTAGQTRLRIASGVVQVPVAVDVCASDLTMPSNPPLVLGTDVAARSITAPAEFDPIEGSTNPGTGAPATVIQLRQPADTDCTGAVIAGPLDVGGFTGTIPTNATLRAAAPDNIPLTYDADTNIWLFIFPVGGDAMGTAALTIPWTDTPDPAALLPSP